MARLNREVLSTLDRPYAVLWDIDKHKSRRWVYSLISKNLIVAPEKALYFDVTSESQVRSLKTLADQKEPIHDFVIFDDAAYGGLKILDTIEGVDSLHRQWGKPRPNFIIVVPYITSEAIALLTTETDLFIKLIFDQKMLCLSELSSQEDLRILRGNKSYLRSIFETFDHTMPDKFKGGDGGAFDLFSDFYDLSHYQSP